MNLDDTSKLLEQRGQVYGNYLLQSRVSARLKYALKLELAMRNKTLAEDQQEALDMIFVKIARIVNGDANYSDSWVDIAGYAKLISDRLEKEQSMQK